jgi:precorrin-6A/cobalt-precorrin-6A reductase
MALKVLILGGTSEARRLAERLASDPRFAALLSFAGRTQSLVDPGVPHRVGGFGGVDGLVAHLRGGGYRALIDATHPFAAQISRNAAVAAERAAMALVRLEVPAWQPVPGDRWLEAPDMPRAAELLGRVPRRVFPSIGRQELGAFLIAPQHDYLLRAVDAFVPALPRARLIVARGPFDLDSECALLERERIEIVVSKNSGTPSTYAKIEAARRLELPVIMVARPSLPAVQTVPDVDRALAWLSALHDASSM